MLKKPWIWPACRSMVTTRSAPGDGDHVGDQARRDRHARLVLLVGAAVGVVGHHAGDALGAGAPQGVHHDQQLHDAAVHRRARRLDDEDVLAAHAAVQLDEDVLVGEVDDVDAAQRDAEALGDLLRQRRVRPPAQQLDGATHSSSLSAGDEAYPARGVPGPGASARLPTPAEGGLRSLAPVILVEYPHGQYIEVTTFPVTCLAQPSFLHEAAPP